MNGWSKPENMGYPLNTVNDDIYFSLSADGYTGYFSSERSGGIGMQDIYQIIFPGSQLDHVFVRGVVADAGNEPIKARLLLTDEREDEIIGVYNTNEHNGRFMMLLAQDQRCIMTIEAKGFLEQRIAITGRPNVEGTREMAFNILLQPEPDRDRLSRQE
jgi:hypothetical protein